MKVKYITLNLACIATAVLIALTGGLSLVFAVSNQDCLGCHDDGTLKSEKGLSMFVSPDHYDKSVHSGLSCTDCHDSRGDFFDMPHWPVYRKVNCAECHSGATDEYKKSFHGIATSRGVAKSPNCVDCHSQDENFHHIEPLNIRTAENACKKCHTQETGLYDNSIHFEAAQKGKNSPGCVSCHATHTAALPPSAGAINNLCQSCHKGAMDAFWAGDHGSAINQLDAVISCASCHDVHGTHKPHIDTGVIQACATCHPGYEDKFKGSVHDGMFAQGTMNCVSCHTTHQVKDGPKQEQYGCGACHSQVELDYRSSAHRLARLHGEKHAAACVDCHDSHHILPANDPASMTHRKNISVTCGTCHGDEAVITSDFVRLPISLPSYTVSVHGMDDSPTHAGAVCTDCHGVHKILNSSEPTSMISKVNQATTCGQCHTKEAEEYQRSIHGRAVAMGIKHSPSCTDCHDEHMILAVSDPKSAVNPVNQAANTCGKCHENPQLAARYGLPTEIVASYEDTYHGWAIKRGGRNVAVCVDCHNVHEIRAALDPMSSVHLDNVVATCAKCHTNSNPQFAASYSHLTARESLAIHDWVRIIYIWLISLVLGGMVLHNIIIFVREMKKHYKHHYAKPAVRRMTKNEIIQHVILFVTFFGLAITGFALRYTDSWWVKMLVNIGMNEEFRRLWHRVFAIGLVGASFYHLYYIMLTKRGFMLLKAMFPKISDIGEFIANMRHQFNPKHPKPTHGMYDYTQKAEYWALIWGTAIMALTGFILWFPGNFTEFLPAWVIRVASVIHFYEAILAVAAIFIWHFFHVIFLPKEYPMSYTWLTGRMSKEEWDHHHGRADEELGAKSEVLPPEKK